ncbi:hypothetical protein B0T26DRAFT_674129 [Lasiosphaeria miniovina]|uniref:Protein FAF1 n=1 Tax=Lasiosphaeria miniovina TaxID=1954250 RepID=A0AA40AUW9_9PEZI|nr:uncharacterized protein B0T26DRAFT_674129 [Lasiosphaeria miniovina]KAK0722423.1 hypothetical protein B0T26DRAFT_674129 [Lasiosphaeria miniovina]
MSSSTLGKRKSRSAEADSGHLSTSGLSGAQAVLQRHFEARFRPLPPAARAPTPPKATASSGLARHGQDGDGYDENDQETDSDLSDSEWGGVSSDEDEQDDGDNHADDGDFLQGGAHVEVVDHTSSQPTVTSTMSKRELKAYLSSRPPSQPTADAAQKASNSKKDAANDQAEDSAAFLANDLALQRLITESHILSAAGGNASHYLSSTAASSAANTKSFAAGRTRRITTELRVQALGAKESMLTQSKMPMGMRKGISTAAISREAKRRREAKENGIILERESKNGPGAKPAKRKKRSSERPVDMPGIGRMRGAELRISAREAQAIAASGEKKGRDKKSRGRRK